MCPLFACIDVITVMTMTMIVLLLLPPSSPSLLRHHGQWLSQVLRRTLATCQMI
jgi:hypothetical protein